MVTVVDGDCFSGWRLQWMVAVYSVVSVAGKPVVDGKVVKQEGDKVKQIDKKVDCGCELYHK